jgi:hypothetical protein
MKVHFTVHSKIVGLVTKDGQQIFDDRNIVSDEVSLELAIVDMQSQIEAITLSTGEKLELLSFKVGQIEA